MHTYRVHLIRYEASAGPRATLRVTVQAPDGPSAKHTAQAQWPGYRATQASRVP